MTGFQGERGFTSLQREMRQGAVPWRMRTPPASTAPAGSGWSERGVPAQGRRSFSTTTTSVSPARSSIASLMP